METKETSRNNCLLSKKYEIQFPSLKCFVLGYSNKCTPFFLENMWPNDLIADLVIIK